VRKGGGDVATDWLKGKPPQPGVHVYTDPDLIPFEPPARPLGLRGLPTTFRNYIETIPRAAYEQGVVDLGRTKRDIILVAEPDLIGEVLVGKAELVLRDPVTRRAFAPAIGANSIFLAEDSEWRWQRRAVAPIFRHETLLSFVPIFTAMAERQVERWRAAGRTQQVDAAAAMTRTTFDIIVEALLGGSANLDAESYSRALTQSFNTIPWQIIYVLFSLPEWLPYPGQRRAYQARDFLRRDLSRIVAARRAAPSAHADLLDALLAARDAETGRSMSDAEVVNNLLTFVIAGHETTAVALSWTLWLLAKDQDSQQRVFDEVAAVAADAPIAAAHFEQLSFCRQAIQEAMRLYPPAPGIGREARTAFELGGLSIAPGTRIHIPVFALHRNVRIWNNPNCFDPDRFTAEAVKARSRYAYLPFGAGPRICIGSGFAMLEAAAILATLVRAFRFTPVPGHKPKPLARVTLRPAGGMPLRVAVR
jgi:cytochrome P450